MHPKPVTNRLWLWGELVSLFGLLPLVCWRFSPPIIPVLLLMAGGLYWRLRRDASFDRRVLTRLPTGRADWWRLLGASLLSLPILILLAWWLQPDALFDLPRQRTKLWLFVMVAYPLVSVVAQEVVFRAYFCHRFRPLLGHGLRLPVTASVAFGFAHVVFGNWVAVTLTFLGGWMFTRTYLRTGSLPLVIAQHALYGGTIFTVGLGRYFLHGTTRFIEALLGPS